MTRESDARDPTGTGSFRSDCAGRMKFKVESHRLATDKCMRGSEDALNRLRQYYY